MSSWLQFSNINRKRAFFLARSTSAEGIVGFTLVELLVAVSILILLACILLSIATSVSNTWQRGIAHEERRTAALAVFTRMSRDMRTAAQPSDLAGTNLVFAINPVGSGGSPLLSSNYSLPQSAFWESPVATDRSQGDLAMVGYFVQWVSNVPKLCRVIVNPGSSAYPIEKGLANCLSDSMLATNAPATSNTAYTGQLAEYVLGLWMRPLDQRMQPITRMANTNSFGTGQFDSSKGYISSNGNTYPSGLPANVEVAIITVDSRTAKRLTGAERPNTLTTNMWNDVTNFFSSLPQDIRQGAEIHSQIISLMNAPR